MPTTVPLHLTPPAIPIPILTLPLCSLSIYLVTLNTAHFLERAVSMPFLHGLCMLPAYDPPPPLAVHATLQVSASCQPHPEGTSQTTPTKQATPAKRPVL